MNELLFRVTDNGEAELCCGPVAVEVGSSLSRVLSHDVVLFFDGPKE